MALASAAAFSRSAFFLAAASAFSLAAASFLALASAAAFSRSAFFLAAASAFSLAAASFFSFIRAAAFSRFSWALEAASAFSLAAASFFSLATLSLSALAFAASSDFFADFSALDSSAASGPGFPYFPYIDSTILSHLPSYLSRSFGMPAIFFESSGSSRLPL